jgi:hypothetical protein
MCGAEAEQQCKPLAYYLSFRSLSAEWYTGDITCIYSGKAVTYY